MAIDIIIITVMTLVFFAWADIRDHKKSKGNKKKVPKQAKKRGPLKNDKKHGYWEDFWLDGSRRPHTKGIYQNDIPIGLWKAYNLSTKLKQETYFIK